MNTGLINEGVGRVLARIFLKRRHRVLQRNQGDGMRRAAVSYQKLFGLKRRHGACRRLE